MRPCRPGQATLIVVVGVAATGCALDDAVGGKSKSSTAVVDQTRWEVFRSFPTDLVRLSVEVSEYSDTDVAGWVKTSLERELAARGFTIDGEARYRLTVQCGKPIRGTRGLPVTSRFLKVTLEVSLAPGQEQHNLILKGYIDGILEESAVSIFSSSDQARLRLERALSSATGKIARYLVAASASSRHLAESEVVSHPQTLLPIASVDRSQTTLAVLDFDVGTGVDESVGQALADICRDSIGKTGRFILLERNNIKAILGEQDFAAAVRCTETSCLVQYGRVLHAQKIIHGRASKIGKQYVLFVSMSDVATAVVDATEVSPRSQDLEGLADSLPAQAANLVKGF